MNNQYSTLSIAINDLAKKGFTANFRVNEGGSLEANEGQKFDANEVRMTEFHRFEGMSDPADNTILYALETRSGLKGTLVDSYGHDSSERISDFMDKVGRANDED